MYTITPENVKDIRKQWDVSAMLDFIVKENVEIGGYTEKKIEVPVDDDFKVEVLLTQNSVIAEPQACMIYAHGGGGAIGSA